MATTKQHGMLQFPGAELADTAVPVGKAGEGFRTRVTSEMHFEVAFLEAEQ